MNDQNVNNELSDADLDCISGGGDSPSELYDQLKGWVRLGIKKVKEALTIKIPG